jgi:hypothetical protein
MNPRVSFGVQAFVLGNKFPILVRRVISKSSLWVTTLSGQKNLRIKKTIWIIIELQAPGRNLLPGNFYKLNTFILAELANTE